MRHLLVSGEMTRKLLPVSWNFYRITIPAKFVTSQLRSGGRECGSRSESRLEKQFSRRKIKSIQTLRENLLGRTETQTDWKSIQYGRNLRVRGGWGVREGLTAVDRGRGRRSSRRALRGLETHPHRRRSRNRIRPATRWPRCLRTWRWTSRTVGRRTCLWSPASIRLCTTTDPSFQHPNRVFFRFAIVLRRHFRWNRQKRNWLIVGVLDLLRSFNAGKCTRGNRAIPKRETVGRFCHSLNENH